MADSIPGAVSEAAQDKLVKSGLKEHKENSLKPRGPARVRSMPANVKRPSLNKVR